LLKILIGNSDENFLLYHLSNSTELKQEDRSYIELSDFNHGISLNTDSTISKNLLSSSPSSSPGLLSVDLEKLYKEYFNNSEFKDLSVNKLEKMSNDFKIFLRLIESFKQNYFNDKEKFKSNSNPSQIKNTNSNGKLIDL
jgi:hypothetical protein